MKWFLEAASSPATGQLSSSRVIALFAGMTFSACTLVLTPLAYLKPELITPLTTFGTVLGALAGSNYVTGKIMAGKKNDDTSPSEPVR